MIKLQPHIDVGPDDLIEFQGTTGQFYICTAGGKPELEHCFFLRRRQVPVLFLREFRARQPERV